MKRFALSFAALLIFTAGISAQSQTPGINQRQRNQQARIHQGIRSGELTPREARRLQHQQLAIQTEKRIAKSDGVVTRCERTGIYRHQNFASRNIYCKKHNNKHRI